MLNRKKKVLSTAALILAAGLMLFGCSTNTVPGDPLSKEAETDSKASLKKETEADNIPVFGSFTAYTHDGLEVNQDIFAEAGLTMVNIWGTFCSPCIDEMPDLAELSKEYEEKDVQIIGIMCDVYAPENEDAQAIIDATGADYTHLILSEDLYNNYLYQVQSVPTTVFVDRDGLQVGNIVMGSRDKETWTSILDKLLSDI